MYNAILCMNIGKGFGIRSEKMIEMLKKVGFEGFFPVWTRGEDMSDLRTAADKNDMLFQSVHAPFANSNRMWMQEEENEMAVKELIECVEECHNVGVPLMIAHAFIGFKDHTPSVQGIASFERVVKRAEELGVKIAFENTEGIEYLEALMEHFKGNKNVGFCWDTGHELCYNYSRDMLSLYGDRLMATHLNDNLGIKDKNGVITYIDDLHLLPFDGIADWKGIAGRLDKHNYRGVLTFELTRISKPDRRENDTYAKMELEDYLTLAYMRACRVAALRTVPSVEIPEFTK